MASPRVLAYTITRADTPERARLLNNTLTLGRDIAGMDFHWIVYCVEGTLGHDIADAALKTGVIQECVALPENRGQHPPTNDAIDMAIKDDHDYLLRVDDDVEWRTKRWLAKLVETSQKQKDTMVLSPTVKGLRNIPEQTETVEVEGVPLRFLLQAIGGICRLTPVGLLKEKPYASDVRFAMGAGDAVSIGDWCIKNKVWMAWCQNIRVRHGKSTDEQERLDPEHFTLHAVLQQVPYMPSWE